MRQSILLVIFILIFTPIDVIAQDGWFHQDGTSERTSYVQSSMKPPFALTRTVDLPRNIEGFTYAYGMIYFFTEGHWESV